MVSSTDVLTLVLGGLVAGTWLVLVRHLPLFTILCLFLSLRVLVDGPWNFVAGPVTATGLLGIVAVGLGCAICLQGGEKAGQAALLMVVLASTQLLGNPEFADPFLEELVRTGAVVSIFLVARNLPRVPSLRALSRCMQFIALPSVFFGFVQLISGQGLVVDGIARANGLLAHPNSAALLYGFVAVMCFVMFIEGGHRRSDAALFFLYVLGVISTVSLGGMLTLAVMLFVYLVTAAKRGRVASATAGLVGLLGAAGALAWLHSTGRLLEVTQVDLMHGTVEDTSLEWRIGRWLDLLPYWVDRPIFGQGYGASTSGLLLGGYVPHNEYVRCLVEIGLAGAAIAVFFVLRLVQMLRRALHGPMEPLAAASLACVAGLLTNALSENTFLYSVPMFWLAALIGVASSNHEWVRSRTLATGRRPNTSPRGSIVIAR